MMRLPLMISSILIQRLEVGCPKYCIILEYTHTRKSYVKYIYYFERREKFEHKMRNSEPLKYEKCFSTVKIKKSRVFFSGKTIFASCFL